MAGKIACSFCEKLYSKGYIKTHEKRMHGEKTETVEKGDCKKEKVPCSYCQKLYSKGYIKQHEKKCMVVIW